MLTRVLLHVVPAPAPIDDPLDPLANLQSPVEKVKRLLPQLSQENRRALYAALAVEFADAPVSLPIADPPGKVADVQQPRGILGRRRAG